LIDLGAINSSTDDIALKRFWKKEQIEEIELRDNLKDFLLSLSKDRNEDSQKLKSQKQEENESTARIEAEKWGTLDALG
jgi:hypothetical protein